MYATCLPTTGKQVVFAEAHEPDVLDQDHLIVFLREQLVEVNARILLQALEDLGVHPGDALGRLTQSLAIGIFTDRQQDLANRPRIRSRSITLSFAAKSIPLDACLSGSDALEFPLLGTRDRERQVGRVNVSRSQFGSSENERFIVGSCWWKINRPL